jgi:predicted nucleotidyltransferase
MVNIYKPQFSLLQQEILRYLIVRAGKSFNARGLARSLIRTQAGIIKAVPELEKQGLIKTKKDKDSGRWSIGLNRDRQETFEFKRTENLKMIYESGLAKFLEDSFPGTTIILFGSYSRGDDVWAEEDEGHRSDIDIAVIGTKGKEIDLEKFDNLLEREVIINFYPSFKDIHKNLRDNILNGILLFGSVDI